jgi:hypothetical protein
MFGIPHTFQAADFKNFATAVMNYYKALLNAKATQQATGTATWPTPSAVIP